MLEVLDDISNLSEWDEAIHELQKNEGLVAAWQVTDEDTAQAAIVTAPTRFGAPTLDLSVLGKTFSEALKLSYNASSPTPISRLPCRNNAPFRLIKDRGLTGLHMDSYLAGRPYPLNNHLVLAGSVEISFVPIQASEIIQGFSEEDLADPQILTLPLPKRILDELVGSVSEASSATQLLLPHRYITKDAVIKLGGQSIVASSGTLLAFSGSYDYSSGRLPVPHQFRSRGTAEQQAQRQGAFIDTESFGNTDRRGIREILTDWGQRYHQRHT